jgi:hypothetical protein
LNPSTIGFLWSEEICADLISIATFGLDVHDLKYRTGTATSNLSCRCHDGRPGVALAGGGGTPTRGGAMGDLTRESSVAALVGFSRQDLLL